MYKYLTVSRRLQSAVQQGSDLTPDLPLLAVLGGHVDEQLVLQQHVDVPGLQAAPAALRPARRQVVFWSQVVQNRAFVPPSGLQLDGETQELRGEACDLHLEGERSGGG